MSTDFLSSDAAVGSRPVLVLDTNVVLDIFVFRDRGIAALSHALAGGKVEAVTSPACIEELRRVLAYPALGLADAARVAVLEAYRRQSVLIDVTAAPDPDLPHCTDPDDQKFLELAWHARAASLVTRDRSLLRLRRACARLGLFDVLGPQTWAERHPLG